MIGIYLITNLTNKKRYVGKSKNIENRWKQHKKLNDGYRPSYLQSAFLKEGIENFSFEVWEECILEKLNEREKFWIKELETRNPEFGYNLTKGGDGGDTFYIQSEEKQNELRKIFSENSKKYNTIKYLQTDRAEQSRKPHRKKLGQNAKGKTWQWNEEKRKNYIPSNKGKLMNNEQKEKQKQYHWFNNGIIQIMSIKCPENFNSGMLKRKTN